ncbi:MAG: four helix bundle protein [Verrucomicrobia bacterium]|nr:four helix bundle protein [Verrucomicrobiota bacterium]
MSQRFIPSHGGYRKLQSYRKSEIIYDATVYFTKRFFRQGDRTVDQMVQAARSGKQNIAEASMASGTSKETEIKLTNVARASLEELLIDYRDFLRTHSLLEWSKEHPYAMRLSDLLKQKDTSYNILGKGIEHEDPAICTNVIIGLIKVTSYLLHKQISRLEEDFILQGGLRERMTQARLASRRLR